MDFSEADTYGVVSGLMRYDVDAVSGVKRLIEHCNGLLPGAVWSEIAALNFAKDSDDLKQWLHDLLETEMPEDSITAFWFGLFDEARTDGRCFTRLYLSGSASYDPDDKAANWACSAAYVPKGRYADSQVLRSMSAIMGVAGGEASRLGSYVLPLGYASLAVAEACRRLPRHLLLGGRTSRAAAVGFDSGDFITLPLINRQVLSV
ncbi:MAG: hypothetical protein ACLQPN_11565 [Bryobacteraceae bacterium]